MSIRLAFLFLLLGTSPAAAGRDIRVFIALCDNKTQGILPVGEKIGNGDAPDANLYWGCSDGFGSYFKRSKNWKSLASRSDVSPEVLREVTLKHTSGKATLTAEAYRGSAMRKCIEDFEAAAASGKYDMVVYIGHNGLMDFALPNPASIPTGKTHAIVLCCMSKALFAPRLEKLGCRPVLLTQQLMYPGAFILHDALESWLKQGSLEEIRLAAGKAYAKNQKISVNAGCGIFSPPGKN